MQQSLIWSRPIQTKINSFKMKMIVVAALALVAAVAAAPPAQPGDFIPIVRSEFVQSPEGGFQSSFETGNGIAQAATGELKQVNDENNKPVFVLVQRGSYSYPDEQGKPIAVEWSADENGYQAFGDSIPKPASRR